ncbi:hypothetical protein [Kluyvera intermedia]|uniref:hypothetical protein n=1 Tax=Kluyvera intermedia TaxID=61648 RepID=UPI003709C7DD
MKCETIKSTQENTPDIQTKLKLTGSHWSYLKLARPSSDGSNYEFNQCLIGKTEYAIYERQGHYFVLVDFFKDYSKANSHAKEIIDNNSQLKQIFNLI